LFTCDLAREYGFTDIDGKYKDWRSLHNMLMTRGYTSLATFVPWSIRIPHWLMHYSGYKF